MENFDSTHTNNNPFKGPSSYAEGDTIYGREPELNQLIGIINQHTLSLLFSKSGVGKTSLLKAGVIPVFKSRPDFFPIYMRVTEIPQDEAFPELVINYIKKYAKQRNVDIVYDVSVMPQKPTITEFLYLSEFIFISIIDGIKNQYNSVPVLIFDQAEVIFTGLVSGENGEILSAENNFNKKVTAFLEDIKNIIEGRIPDTFLNNIGTEEKVNKDSLISKLKSRLQYNTKWYRILFSFREEYLHRFESLKFQIPYFSKGNNRLHLESFAVENASEVIIEISKQSIEIEKPIAAKLSEILSTTDQDLTKTEQQVPPFMLSLVCRNIYNKLTSQNPDKQLLKMINDLDISLVMHVVDEYAKEVFGKISPETKKYVEEKLITEGGNRTMSAITNLNDQIIKRELDALCDVADIRYLNKIDYFGEAHIEILHDRLLKPCIVSRELRRKKEFKEQQTASEKKKTNRILLALGLTVLFLLLGILFFLNEKTKKEKYLTFFKHENVHKLEEFKKNIDDNSIGALINILNYEEDTRDLPHSKNSFFGFDIFNRKHDVSDELKDFQVFICKSLDSTALFYKYVFDNNSYLSVNQFFRFRDSIKGNDTIIYTQVDKFIDTGFVKYGYIEIRTKDAKSIEGRNQNDSSIVSRYRDYRFKNLRFLSYSDSLVYAVMGDSLYIYNLYKKSDKGEINTIKKFNVQNSKFKLSSDGRLVFISPIITVDYKKSQSEQISAFQLTSGKQLASLNLPSNYSNTLFPREYDYFNYYLSRYVSSDNSVSRPIDLTNEIKADDDKTFCYTNNNWYFLSSKFKSENPSSKDYSNRTYKLMSFPEIFPEKKYQEDSINNIKFYSNSFVAGFSGSHLRVFDLTLKKQFSLDSLPFRIQGIYFVNNDKWVLLVGSKGEMELYEIKTKNKLLNTKNDGNSFGKQDSLSILYNTFLSPDESKILFVYRKADYKKEMYYARLINLRSMKLISFINNLNTAVTYVRFSDSTLILNSSYGNYKSAIKWYYLKKPPFKFEDLKQFYYKESRQFPEGLLKKNLNEEF